MSHRTSMTFDSTRRFLRYFFKLMSLRWDLINYHLDESSPLWDYYLFISMVFLVKNCFVVLRFYLTTYAWFRSKWCSLFMLQLRGSNGRGLLKRDDSPHRCPGILPFYIKKKVAHLHIFLYIIILIHNIYIDRLLINTIRFIS